MRTLMEIGRDFAAALVACGCMVALMTLVA
jgi:hypothetical protein